jgi:hypothetical protein
MTWGSEWRQEAPSEIVSIYDNEIRSASRSEVVVLQKVLADRANQGYHDVEMLVVDKVEGRNIRDLKELIRIVESAKGEFVRFQGSDGHTIVLKREGVEKRNRSILRRYGVPADRSENLQKKAK